mmetsp:Transcript_65922/g.175564  ORF Transcript_65922/g.175564 Transcript_65922/m.175564 type:complete len:303 (-) Transcript_65922:27-935(-)
MAASMACCLTSGSAKVAGPAVTRSTMVHQSASKQLSLKNSGSSSAAETNACKVSFSCSSFAPLAKPCNTVTMAGITTASGFASSGSRSSTSCNTSSADAPRTSGSESPNVVESMARTCSPWFISPSPKFGTSSFRTSSATTRHALLPPPMKRESAGRSSGHSCIKSGTLFATLLAIAAATSPVLRFTKLLLSCSSVLNSCTSNAFLVETSRSSQTTSRPALPVTSCRRMTAASCRSSGLVFSPAASTSARLPTNLSGEPDAASSRRFSAVLRASPSGSIVACSTSHIAARSISDMAAVDGKR